MDPVVKAPAVAAHPDPGPGWQPRFWAIFGGQASSLVGSALTQFVLLWWITAPLLPTGLPSLTQILAALTARDEGATLTEIGDALKITRSGALHMLRRAEGAKGRSARASGTSQG